MAMVDLGTVIPLWDITGNGISTFAVASTGFVIDAASEKAGLSMQAPKTGNINKLGFYVAAHTSGATLDCRVETLSATTGLPSGTLFATNTSGTAVTTAIGWYESTLTASAAVTKGDRIGLVVAQPSSSPGNCAIGDLVNYYGSTSIHSFPFGGNYVSSWAAAQRRPLIFAGYDDSTWGYCPQNMPITAVTTLSLNTGSTPDEAANRFDVAAPCRVVGARLFLNGAGDSRDFTIVIYDSGSSVVATETFDSGQMGVNGVYWVDYFFDAAVDLSAGTYRLAVKPTTASNNQVVYVTMPSSTGIRTAMPGGSNVYYSARSDAGAWTDTTTQYLIAAPLVSGFDDGAGGGGGDTGGLRRFNNGFN